MNDIDANRGKHVTLFTSRRNHGCLCVVAHHECGHGRGLFRCVIRQAVVPTHAETISATSVDIGGGDEFEHARARCDTSP